VSSDTHCAYKAIGPVFAIVSRYTCNALYARTVLLFLLRDANGSDFGCLGSNGFYFSVLFDQNPIFIAHHQVDKTNAVLFFERMMQVIVLLTKNKLIRRRG
jgi:hypothetical protein